MLSFIWWLGLILVLVSVPIPFYCAFSDKADKRLNNLAILYLSFGTFLMFLVNLNS